MSKDEIRKAIKEKRVAKKVTIADVAKAVGHRDPTKERIFIRGDENMQYQDFMAVMNKLQDNGFYSVALVGEDKRGKGH